MSAKIIIAPIVYFYVPFNYWSMLSKLILPKMGSAFLYLYTSFTDDKLSKLCKLHKLTQLTSN